MTGSRASNVQPSSRSSRPGYYCANANCIVCRNRRSVCGAGAARSQCVEPCRSASLISKNAAPVPCSTQRKCKHTVQRITSQSCAVKSTRHSPGRSQSKAAQGWQIEAEATSDQQATGAASVRHHAHWSEELRVHDESDSALAA